MSEDEKPEETPETTPESATGGTGARDDERQHRFSADEERRDGAAGAEEARTAGMGS